MLNDWTIFTLFYSVSNKHLPLSSMWNDWTLLTISIQVALLSHVQFPAVWCTNVMLTGDGRVDTLRGSRAPHSVRDTTSTPLQLKGAPPPIADCRN